MEIRKNLIMSIKKNRCSENIFNEVLILDCKICPFMVKKNNSKTWNYIEVYSTERFHYFS